MTDEDNNMSTTINVFLQEACQKLSFFRAVNVKVISLSHKIHFLFCTASLLLK